MVDRELVKRLSGLEERTRILEARIEELSSRFDGFRMNAIKNQKEHDEKIKTLIQASAALKRREDEGRPIRVGIVGAGFMSQGLSNQIAHSTPGMRVAAISNRKPQRALDVLRYSGFEDARIVESQAALDKEISAGRPAATADAMLIARSEHVDVVVDATGSVEFGAHLALEAFKHGKDVVLLNAEIDAVLLRVGGAGGDGTDVLPVCINVHPRHLTEAKTLEKDRRVEALFARYRAPLLTIGRGDSPGTYVFECSELGQTATVSDLAKEPWAGALMPFVAGVLKLDA